MLSLESASWWKSMSVTQAQWSSAASLSCDQVPAYLGQGCRCDLWQGFSTDQPGRRGSHGMPAATIRANCEADAWGFLHTSNISVFWLCLAVWQAGAGFLWAWGMVVTQFGPASSPCHPTFRSSATCSVLGMETFLTQGLGIDREVVPWRPQVWSPTNK